MGSETVYKIGAAALNNPLSGDTLVTTETGVVSIESLEGRKTRLLTHDGFKEATVKCYGEQKVQEIVFAPMYKAATWRKRINGKRRRVVATVDHGWPVEGIAEKVHDLAVGQIVKAVSYTPQTESAEYRYGFVHGILFGDGTKGHDHTDTETSKYQLRLCGEKANLAEMFIGMGFNQSEIDGDPYFTKRSAIRYKEVPTQGAGADYVAGFIEGWLSTDGTKRSATGFDVASTDLEALDWLENNAQYAGYIVHNRRTEKRTATNYSQNPKRMDVIGLSTATVGWEVESITPIQTPVPVYCATVPEAGYFALAGGIYTGNCGSVDVKHLSEDAAWTMDFLMLGVGTGHNTTTFKNPEYTMPARKLFALGANYEESFVEALQEVINSFKGEMPVQIDYSAVGDTMVKEKERVRDALASIHHNIRESLYQFVLHRKMTKEVLAQVILDHLEQKKGKEKIRFGLTYEDVLSMLSGKITAPLSQLYQIPDTREGWVESVRLLIESYEDGLDRVEFTYSKIRKAGEPIRGFGGTASGPEPLIKLHDRLRNYLDSYAADRTSGVRMVVDVMNAIGACVVAGNVRRSAEISLGSASDTEFINLKNYELYPERAELGWMSNNSIVIKELDDLKALPTIAEKVRNNGEPGLINLLNIQKYGRYGEKSTDKATSTNPCVTGDTRILTKEGYQEIQTLVGREVEVWNGFEWSNTTPKITGKNQDILGITFSDGTYLKTTPYHGFKISEKYGDKSPADVEARDLKIGDKLWKYQMPVVAGREEEESGSRKAFYTQGFYSGDGFVNSKPNGPNTWLYGKKSALVGYLDGSICGNPTEDRIGVRLNLVDTSKTFIPHNESVGARLSWFAGLLDSDGNITKDGNLQITSTNEGFLNETRLMLTTLGVQAKVTKNREESFRRLPNGKGGTTVYACKAIYRLMTTVQDTISLKKLGLETRRLSLGGIETDRNASRFVTVEQVEYIGVADYVYCFTEPKNHTGTFEGIVTGQCAEIPLESYELCNLAEVFPTKCVGEDGKFDLNEFKRVLGLAALYTSTVSLLPTHDAKTNAVVARNRRTGVSLSGIADWMAEYPATNVITWLDEGYKTVRAENTRLNEEAGVPPAVRVTTVKPSGTVSLLAGVSSGMHLPPFSRYIRRVRVGENTPIVPLLIEAGIPHEKDVYSDNTLVFEFPVDQGKVKGQKDVSVWAKAQTVVMLQRWWADNMVSNTLTFDPVREGDQIEDLLTFTVPNVKSLSLLPLLDEGSVYAQSPIEQITLEEVNRRKKEIGKVDWNKFSGSDGSDSKFCANDSCEI